MSAGSHRHRSVRILINQQIPEIYNYLIRFIITFFSFNPCLFTRMCIIMVMFAFRKQVMLAIQGILLVRFLQSLLMQSPHLVKSNYCPYNGYRNNAINSIV